MAAMAFDGPCEPPPPRASQVAQWVNILSAMQETWLRSLGQEDSVEERRATRSNILAWRNSMDRGAWRAI